MNILVIKYKLTTYGQKEREMMNKYSIIGMAMILAPALFFLIGLIAARPAEGLMLIAVLVWLSAATVLLIKGQSE
jgi:hypothetical protein